MDTEEWWTTYHGQHADFREWVLEGSEVADGVGGILAAAARAAPGGHGQGRVLHIGCGSSTLHENLLRAGFGSVVNVDFSADVVRRMREKFSTSAGRVSFVVADVRDLAPTQFGGPASFDCVVGKGLFDCLLSHGSEEHKVSNCLRALRSIRALMRPGAVLVETSMFEPPKRLPYLRSGGVFSVEPLTIELNPLELPHQKCSYIYILKPAATQAGPATGAVAAAAVTATASAAVDSAAGARRADAAGAVPASANATDEAAAAAAAAAEAAAVPVLPAAASESMISSDEAVPAHPRDE